MDITIISIQNWYVSNGSLVANTGVTTNCNLSKNENSLILTKVYPNHFTDNIYITSENLDYTLKMYTVLGKGVQIELNENRINTSLLSSRIYFVRMHFEGASKTYKLIKK